MTQAQKNIENEKARTKLSDGQNVAVSKLVQAIRAFWSCMHLIVAVLFFLEWSFAVAHIGEDTVVRPDPLLGYAHLENQSLTYRQEGYSRSRTNSRGFREREFSLKKAAGTTRICLLGDSMTVGMEVPPEKTFSRLLEEQLNALGKGRFEVLNCGMSGFGTGQEYLVYRQKVQQLEPDFVIMTYNVGDAEDNVFQRAGMNPPRPVFRVENGLLKVELDDVNKWLSSNDARFYSSFEWLRRHSRVLAVLTKLNLDLSSADPVYQAIIKTIGKPVAMAWNTLLCQLPPYPQSVIDPDLTSVKLHNPTLSTELAVTAAGSVSASPVTQEIRRYFIATKSKTDVVLGIINALNNDCKKHNCKLIVASGPALTNSIFYYRELQEIRRAAEKEQFTFIEANRYFPPREPMQDSPYFFGLHFTRAGHQIMSRALFEGLLKISAQSKPNLLQARTK